MSKKVIRISNFSTWCLVVEDEKKEVKDLVWNCSVEHYFGEGGGSLDPEEFDMEILDDDEPLKINLDGFPLTLPARIWALLYNETMRPGDIIGQEIY